MRSLGLSPDAFHEWMRKRDREPYATFAEVVDAALASFEQAMVDSMVSGADKDWRAAEALLKVRFPEEYAQPAGGGVQVNVNNTHQEVQVHALSPGALLEVGRLLQDVGALDTLDGTPITQSIENDTGAGTPSTR